MQLNKRKNDALDKVEIADYRRQDFQNDNIMTFENMGAETVQIRTAKYEKHCCSVIVTLQADVIFNRKLYPNKIRRNE